MSFHWFGSSLRYCHRLFLFALSLFVLSAVAQTTNPAYLADMPSVDRVKAQIQGTDPNDTLARQVAVLTYLQQYIQRIKNPRSPFTPDESRVMNAYSVAAYQIQQDYNKAHTPAEAKAFDTLQFNYMLNHGDEWARKLIGPQSAAAYQNTLHDMNTRQQAHVDSINNANEAAKANASHPSSGSTNDPTTLAARRCAELGGTTGGCATKAFGQGLLGMVGGDQLKDQVDAIQTVGVYLSGGWGGNGGSLNFSLQSASIGCGKLVPEPFAYKLQRTSSGIQIFVSSSPNMTLAMRPDGSLIGPGLVTVAGKIITGYSTKTTTLVHQDGSEASDCAGAYGSCRTTTSTPIYAPSTARCNFATLAAPTPSPAAKTGAAADDGSLMGGLTGLLTTVVATAEPGLRMNGKFLSSTGLILDFEGDAVTMDCGSAHIKAPYTVQNAPGEFRISVNNSGGPFTLTLAPDNTLHGSGSTTVHGKLYSSIDNSGNVSFRPVSATCSVNTFTSKSPAEYKALISNPPAPGR